MKTPPVALVLSAIFAIVFASLLFVPRGESKTTDCSLAECPIKYHDQFKVSDGNIEETVTGITFDDWHSLTSEEFRVIDPVFARTRSYLITAYPTLDESGKVAVYDRANVNEIANGYFASQISTELSKKLGDRIRLTMEPAK